MSFHAKANQMRCFKCHARGLSTIDVTMLVLNCKPGEAIRFLASQFEVPVVRQQITTNTMGKTKHRFTSYAKPAEPMSVETLMLSAAWPTMPTAAREVLAALILRVPRAGSERGRIHSGYDHIGEWTGFGRATVMRALRWLRLQGWISTTTIPTRWRTSQGFPVRELFITVHSHRQRAHATGTVVPKRASQYAGSIRASSGELAEWTPSEGAPIQ